MFFHHFDEKVLDFPGGDVALKAAGIALESGLFASEVSRYPGPDHDTSPTSWFWVVSLHLDLNILRIFPV